MESLDLSSFSKNVAMLKKLRQVIWDRRAVFKGTGHIQGVAHRIKVPHDTAPICDAMRRRSPAEEETEREAMAKLLEAGIMEPSTSAWASHNVMVRKKDGTFRTTTVFRRLNSVTTADAYPMEDMSAAIEWLAQRRIFTMVDLKQGFFQIDLAVESRPLTAVRTVLGLLQYTRLPQGLKNSPAVCQRAVNHILGDLKGQQVLAYRDDILAGSMGEEEHVQLVRLLLDRILDAGARLQLKKCRFGVREVDALGHRVNADGISPSTSHVDAIRRLREPCDAASLLRFIGMVSFFSKFVPDAASHLAPLYQVLEGTGWNRKKPKSRPVIIQDFAERWTVQARQAWEHLRKTLASPEVLVPPRPGALLRLVTDASEVSYGAVLLQASADAALDWRPIGYVARKLSGAEGRYTVTEKEAGAVVFAIAKFRHILLGRRFTLVTDHTALRALLTHSQARGRLARWAIAVQEYEFDVEYCKGGEGAIVAADALSRDTMAWEDMPSGRAKYPCVCCGDAGEDLEGVTILNIVADCEHEGKYPDLVPSARVVEEGAPPAAAEVSSTNVSSEEDQNNVGVMPATADILAAQKIEFSSNMENPDPEYFVDEEGLLCRLCPGSGRPQVLIPAALRHKVLSWAHGPLSGHYGVARTCARLSGLFWPGLRKEAQEFIRGCLICFLTTAGKPRRQADMVQWTPSRRFEVVAADVLAVSPTSKSGMKKVLVISDCLTRFVVAAALPDETASTLTKALLERWFLVFGPPERFLTDRGPAFTGRLLARVAQKLGVNKVWTSPYHPQCDGMVERFNRTVVKALRSLVVLEDRWDESLALAVWQYNSSVHSVTGITPFRAMLGVEPWDFTENLHLRFIEEAAQDLASPDALEKELSDLHASLYVSTSRARSQAAKFYDRAVEATTYKSGDRVLIWQPAAAVDTGRKLHVPWLGPCTIRAVVGVVATAVSDVTGAVVRSHVNRLKIVPDGMVESAGPASSLYPDTRRLIAAIVASEPDPADGTRIRYKVKSVGRSGYRWTTELPDIVK